MFLLESCSFLVISFKFPDFLVAWKFPGFTTPGIRFCLDRKPMQLVHSSFENMRRLFGQQPQNHSICPRPAMCEDEAAGGHTGA